MGLIFAILVYSTCSVGCSDIVDKAIKCSSCMVDICPWFACIRISDFLCTVDMPKGLVFKIVSSAVRWCGLKSVKNCQIPSHFSVPSKDQFLLHFYMYHNIFISLGNSKNILCQNGFLCIFSCFHCIKPVTIKIPSPTV